MSSITQHLFCARRAETAGRRRAAGYTFEPHASMTSKVAQRRGPGAKVRGEAAGAIGYASKCHLRLPMKMLNGAPGGGSPSAGQIRFRGRDR
jgi:hypothetical protein